LNKKEAAWKGISKVFKENQDITKAKLGPFYIRMMLLTIDQKEIEFFDKFIPKVGVVFEGYGEEIEVYRNFLLCALKGAKDLTPCKLLRSQIDPEITQPYLVFYRSYADSLIKAGALKERKEWMENSIINKKSTFFEKILYNKL